MSANPRQPSWGEVLDVVQTARLRGVHTAMVGEIRSYDEAKQTAEVTLAVQLEASSGVFETVAPQGDLPVVWPGAWAAGDTCLLVFCEESFAKWWDTGSVEQPEVLRRHGLHGVCIPVVARAGQLAQFVALEPGVASVLNAFINATKTVIAAALDAGIPSAARTAFAGAATAVQTQITLGAMAAQKVKAR